MTFEDIAQMAEECGLPCAYDHFPEGESPNPPFLLFLMPGENNFHADGTVYERITDISFELYTDDKNVELERQVEAVILSHELNYRKSEVWIETEKLYEVLYELEAYYE